MIYLGADHNGFRLKEKIKAYLTARSMQFQDLGDKKLNSRDDYVDFAVKVARTMSERDLGILICGSGHGMVVAANKIKNIRAILAVSPVSAREGRHDDHANIVVLSSWHTNLDQAKKILATFFSTLPGREVRHKRRLRKIKQIENDD